MGVVVALTLGAIEGPPEGAKTERTGQYNPEQGGRPEDVAEKAASDGPSEAAYLDEVADIQNGSVEASLRSNNKLLRYDGLTAEDVEELKANYVALENYARRARDLAPSAEHEDQYKVFLLAINELRDANELAYRLAADSSSATQTDFEAYDRHVDIVTAYLRRSNEMLGHRLQDDRSGAGDQSWVRAMLIVCCVGDRLRRRRFERCEHLCVRRLR